eukprot:Gb_10186 [translate_table: standard]
MPRFKKSTVNSRHSSYKSLYVNPLTELKNDRSRNSSSDRSSGNLNLHLCRGTSIVCETENADIFSESLAKVRSMEFSKGKSPLKKEKKSSKKSLQSSKKNASSVLSESRVLKPSSLQFCIQINEPESKIGRFNAPSTPNNSMFIWDDSDAEAAPAPSWSTLPNRSLLCRPLPPDIGRCTCYIVREQSDGLDKASVYSLYTNEGHGRQDRKLAVARHRRRGGRSEFIIAQSCFGILSKSDEGFLGTMTANLVGSRYHIWDQGNPLDSHGKDSRQLLGVVTFVPTVTTLTGSFRSMRACIPKHQSLQIKNTTQHANGLPKDWEENIAKVHQLWSKVPYYNKDSKRYELDFRDRARLGHRIRTSVKNFQLTMEENGKQSILLLGKIGESKYIMDYRALLLIQGSFLSHCKELEHCGAAINVHSKERCLLQPAQPVSYSGPKNLPHVASLGLDNTRANKNFSLPAMASFSSSECRI